MLCVRKKEPGDLAVAGRKESGCEELSGQSDFD